MDEKRKEAIDAMLNIYRSMTMEDVARAAIEMVKEMSEPMTIPIIDPIKEAELSGFMRAVEMLRGDEIKRGCPIVAADGRFYASPTTIADWLEARKP